MTKAIPSKYIVLYADDDPDDLMLVEEAFRDYASNVEVVTANDGTEAISYLNNLSPLDPVPCLIILDVNMPRLNGKETLQRIRNHERFAEIPVVMFTTSSMPIDVQFAERLDAGFITKPLDIVQIRTIAGVLMEHCAEEVKKRITRRVL